MWARVFGDALDLALLGNAVRSWNPKRGAAALALGNVAAVSAVDVLCAPQLPV